MTTEQMRELDAWIAENVMGVKFRRCLMYPKEVKFLSVDDRYPQAIGGETYSPILNCFPNYTTDPAAAMEVLKKCFNKSSPTVGDEYDMEDDGSTSKWFFVHDRDLTGSYTDAETLELAICLFAKKLFTK